MWKSIYVEKRFLPKVSFIFYLLSLIFLVSCGTESGKFRLEGRLRNINQGEFLVYSPDGGLVGIDTIVVRNGRFSYEMDLYDQATLMIVFPNFSEQPVFAKSGAKVTIKGDATHMKEMIIEGTTENEDMTMLRMELNDLTPPDIPNAVSQFIKENRESPVSIYLLQRYFIQAAEPDYRQARVLTEMLLEENPDNGQLLKLKKQLKGLESCGVKALIPKFTATDIQGKKVTEKALNGKVNVVTTWATWSYTSTNVQQRLKQLKSRYGDQLGVVSICLDAQADICRRYIALDSLKWSTVCDGRMWETPLLQKFGLADVPANVLIDGKGRVLSRNLSAQHLEERICKLLK